MHINEMRDAAAKLLTRQEEILAAQHADGNAELTAEESAEFDKIEADLVRAEENIKREEATEARKARFATKLATPEPGQETSDDPAERDVAERAAFNKYLRKGKDNLTPEEKRTLETRTIGDSPLTVTTTAGGYLIPQGFQAELMNALKAYGGVRSVARILSTPTGNDVPWPTTDDTGNVGELLAINTAAADGPVAFGVKTLKAYKYSSKAVLVPIELVQDSAFDIASEILGLFAIRIGRITNTHFTTGDNSAKPQGCNPGAYSATTAQAATGVSYDDLVNLEHSVDPAYRAQGSWMLADSTVKSIKKLKDADGLPIWRAGLTGGDPADILGYRYTVNQDMPAATTALVSVLFGDFSHYIVRDVMAISTLALHERWAEFGQVGFLAFSRHDGRYVVGETNNGAVRSLTQA